MIVLKETSQQFCKLFFIFVNVIFKNDYKLFSKESFTFVGNGNVHDIWVIDQEWGQDDWILTKFLLVYGPKRIASKILRCASYFQLSSRCLNILKKHCHIQVPMYSLCPWHESLREKSGFSLSMLSVMALGLLLLFIQGIAVVVSKDLWGNINMNHIIP